MASIPHAAATPPSDLARARALAILVPAALLAGALGSQYLGGLFPCEMCHWQRWGHYAALAFALASLAARGQPGISRLFVWLALAGIAASGAIGVYHAGVEAGVFQGLTRCTAHVSGGPDLLNQIMAQPFVRCDQVQWSFLGISMAGWNAIVSLGSAMLILWLLMRRGTRSA